MNGTSKGCVLPQHASTQKPNARSITRFAGYSVPVSRSPSVALRPWPGSPAAGCTRNPTSRSASHTCVVSRRTRRAPGWASVPCVKGRHCARPSAARRHARRRTTELLARIQQLEERVEVLYGELYAKPVGQPQITGVASVNPAVW